MVGDLSPQQATFFVILIVAFGLLITEKLRNDLVALLIIVALTATGLLSSSEALAGFGSEPAVTVAAIFVLSQALHQTGLSRSAGALIARLAGESYTRIVAVIMTSVALMSAFTHHVTTTAVMLPVSMTIARERGYAPSKLLMPMSFAASLGTTITIIGAPAFLIASSILHRSGGQALSVFSIAPIGIAITLVGTLFMLTVGRRLLPDRGQTEHSADRFRLTDYFTEVTVLSSSPLVDKPVREIESQAGHRDLFVTGWLRQGRPVRAPFGDQPVQAGDVLMVRTSPEQIVAVREQSGVELHPVHQYGERTTASNGQAESGDEQIEDKLVQAIVAPASDLVGRSLGDVNFLHRYGAIVVGLWRRRGWLNEELSRIRLKGGDVLVLQGDDQALSRVGEDRAFLMLMPFQGESRPRRKAPIAALIMVVTVLVAALNVLPLAVAMIAGGVAMVLSGCVRPRPAYRAIDARIYVFIAGAIPLGDAMEKSGASALMAGWIQSSVGGFNETVVLLIIFGIVAVLTQFMSDSATTALFGPVAAALAAGLGRAPEPFVVTVAMASVVAFITPIGHHGNLLIYGPGRYQFADFVRVGTPLTILIGIVAVLTAQMVWPG
jgi:di/tricarboxylate transporter